MKTYLKKNWLGLLASTIVLALDSSLVAGEAHDLTPVQLFEPLSLPTQPKTSPAALASYPVWLRLEALQNVQMGDVVQLQFSPVEARVGRIQRVERRDRQSLSVFGEIGTEEGWFIFTIEAGGIVASLQLPKISQMGTLRNIGDDSFLLEFFDSTKTHPFTCGVVSPKGEPGVIAGPAAPSKAYKGPQHDVMVLYTSGLVNDFPNHFPNTPLDTAIQHFVDYANQCYANSGVQLRMRLAYRGLVDPTFSEAGRDRYWLLDHLTSKNDGFLDQVHGWRATYHADLVCLMYSLDTQQAGGGGLANLLGSSVFGSGNPANWYDYAFSVVEGLWQPSSVEPPVSGMVPTEFAHEIGHNQGLNHNCEDDGGLVPVTSYAYGWRFTGNSGNQYITIMSYASGVYQAASPIAYFSNPSVFFDGQSTGNATTAGCGGTTGARNAQALNLTADFISRLFLRPLDPWVDFNYAGATQNGRYETPWKTLASAINDLPDSNPVNTPEPPTITLKGVANSGPLSITINKRLKLDADAGPVTIGGTL